MNKFLLSFLLFLVFDTSLYSQTSNLGLPLLFKDKIVKTMRYYTTPSVNNSTEIAIEKDRIIQSGEKMYRFGKEFPVSIDIFSTAQQTVLSNGDILYQYGIHSKNAISINLQFDQFELASGVILYIVDPIKRKFDGAYTFLNNNPSKMLGSELIYSDKIIIEVLVPKDKIDQSHLNLSTIIHGYRNLDEMAKALNSSGKCEIDVNCPLGIGWENQRNSVGMIVNGGGFCTGSLINNTSSTILPYFLTAKHCGATPGNWVFRFRWEAPAAQADCGTNVPSVNGPEFMNINGSTLCASNAASDFTLLLLNQAPNPAWGIYYNGWDRTDVPATQLTVIHHPAGDIKKISRDNSTAISSSFSGGQIGSHWRVPSWDEGVTEGGSSGSPLFNQDHRTIGQLQGGESGCGVSSNRLNDDFGKFYTSWNGGGTNSTRLSNWLDPSNLASDFIDGTDPLIPKYTIDGGISNCSILKSTLCGGNLTPKLSIFNTGLDTLFSATIQYGFDGISNLTYNWNGTLVFNQSVEITLPSIVLGGGSHSFNAVFVNHSGADQNAFNDTLKKTFSTIADGGQILFLELSIFCTPDENRWELLDDSNNVLVTGGPYILTTKMPIIDSFCVAPSCYVFKLYDSYGDGIATDGTCVDGFFKIKDSTGTVLNELLPQNAAFGAVSTSNFCAKITENDGSASIKIFPNPVKESIYLLMSKLGRYSVVLSTITGQIVYENGLVENENSFKIDVSSYSKGVYFIKVMSENEQLVQRLIID